MQVWDGLSDARINFNAPYAEPDPYAVTQTSSLFPEIEPMATLVENLNIQRGLLRALANKADTSQSVELLDQSYVLSIERGEGAWPVVTIGGKDRVPTRRLRARLLVSLVVCQIIMR